MRKYIYWLLPFIWMGIIFYSSAQPYEKQDIKPAMESMIDLSFLTPFVEWVSFTYHRSEVSVENLGIEKFIEFFIRKGAHIMVFFILLCLFYIAFKKSMNIKFKLVLIISLFLTTAYAVLDEFHQGLTPNRTPYIGDVILDGFGAAVAVSLILLLKWRKASLKRQKIKK